MPYHVPPGVSVQVPVTVEPDLTGSSLTVTLAALGTSNVNNGTFTIDGAATESVVSSKTVNVTGGTQTAPSAAPGGAYAGNLMLAAQVRGQTTVQSNGFSVAAMPDGVSATYVGPLPGYPTWVGILVSLSLTSDSGSTSDLDQVQWSEKVQVTEQSGSFAGNSWNSSGYLPAVFAPGTATDKNGTNLTGVSLSPGDWTVLQYFMFEDLRTGVTDVPFQDSGYTIYQLMSCGGPGTGVGCSVTTSRTSTAVSIGGTAVLPGAESPSPTSLTQPAVRQ